MVKYIKCPRCELNYINAEEQEYCDVCLAELSGKSLMFAELDEDDEMEKTELCPVCGINYMRYGEKMCEDCKHNSEYEDDDDIDPDKDDEWRNYLDDDDDDMILDDEPVGGIADEIAAEFGNDFDEEEDEYESSSHDDFEEVDYNDVDFDDDEDDDDDYDDDDDDF